MLNYTEASYGRQVIVGFIDAVLSMSIVTFFMIRMPELISSYLNNINGTLLVLIFFIVYRFLTLLFFNQTLGMRLFRVVLLNGEEQPLSFAEKVLAAFFILFRGTGYFQLK